MRNWKSRTNYLRAQNLVLQDNFEFDQEAFCKELHNFLSNHLVFDGLTVEVVEGNRCNLIVCISVCDVKKSHVI